MKKTKFVALFLIVAMIFIIAPMNSFAAPGWLEANDSTLNLAAKNKVTGRLLCELNN